MENLKNNTIMSKQMNLCDTRKGNTFRLFWRDIRNVNCTATRRSPSDGHKNFVKISTSFSWLISHIWLRERSVYDMRTTVHLASMVKDSSWDQ